jgi:glycosyltransferase involved in cell wall biosynthesis
MSHGTPVITSNVSALPEVVGDSGLLVDPTSTDDIYESMRRLIEDASLRNELSQKGIVRSREFTWEATAKETLRIYSSLLNRG